MADAAALAEGILELKANEGLREQIAVGGYKAYMEKCNIDAISVELKKAMGL